MKKIFLFSLLLLASTGLFWAASAHAQTQPTTGGCSGGTCTYVPLEPLPCGPNISEEECRKIQSGNVNFSQYVSFMFRLFITLGALFAVVMLVIAGIGYMISESGVEIQKAKDRAWHAIQGLLLLTACWLILYTINPNLLRFDLFQATVDKAANKSTSPGTTQSGAGGGGTASTPTRITIYPAAKIGDNITLTGNTPENMDRAQQFFNSCDGAGGRMETSSGGDSSTTFSCVAQ